MPMACTTPIAARGRLLRFHRRASAVALVLSAAFGVPTTAVAQETIAEQVEAWYRAAQRSAPGDWGIAIADLQGNTLWERRASEMFIPASTVKLFTTGFARSVLGGGARRETRVLGAGRLEPATGTWLGAWALEVNGDPSLGRRDGRGASLDELAHQLAVSGVERLVGPLHLVERDGGEPHALWPEAWASRHRGRLFAPLVGPLTYHENVVAFSVRPGARSGKRAVLSTASPSGLDRLVRVEARTVQGRRSRLTLRHDGRGGWIVGGTIGSRARTRWFSATAYDPRAVLEASWATALAHAGITWDRNAAPAASSLDVGSALVLGRVASPTLDSLATDVNRRSHNLGAELLLQWAAGRNRPADQLAEHVRLVTGPGHAVHLVDGSGLSSEDRVAPSTFIAYLANVSSRAGADFSQLLPANGTGTLRKLRAGLPERGVVRAKTGTLANVSSVVGYLGRPDGVLLVSLMYNGRRTHQARSEQWRLFRVLGADGVAVPDAFDAPVTDLGGPDPVTGAEPPEAPVHDEAEPAPGS
jgi:D-alanyl-D-alanine carboxypeptidase/D-alanyl-D-alanine-endopeptidase (penicillin-binding protein 4)